MVTENCRYMTPVDPAKNAALVGKMAAALGVNYPILLGLESVFMGRRVTGLPTTFLIDSRGRILEEIDEVLQPDEPRRPDQVVFVQADVERLQHGQEAEDEDDRQGRQQDRVAEEGLLRGDGQAEPGRLLKKAHLRRWRAWALVAAYRKYASLGPSRAALHLDLFEQPAEK